ncbi:hypothetical protein CDL15_Pgr001142 [Punica granatum]|uniref:GRF-type domain-containing protein n=1 Tax=Punica granatum TaxID=22663 RepID=A0A218WKJ6_PUNGR|nr:hypothetical protein CDL15_Pgr001142 [Punica granatum]
MVSSGSIELKEASPILSTVSRGDKECHHGVKAVMLTSWSEKNPGRKFLQWKFWKDDDCKYFEWYDNEDTKHTKDVIRCLIKEKEGLAKELKLIKEKNEILLVKLSTFEDKLEALKLRNDNMEKEIMGMRLQLEDAKSNWNKICSMKVVHFDHAYMSSLAEADSSAFLHALVMGLLGVEMMMIAALLVVAQHAPSSGPLAQMVVKIEGQYSCTLLSSPQADKVEMVRNPSVLMVSQIVMIVAQ